MAEKNTRQTGAEKEAQAAKFLTEKGFHIKEQNFRCRQGEIDIIGMDGEYLVFVEVKFRSGREFENPLAAVGISKQRKICRVADYYRFQKQFPPDTPVRYDVVGILGEEIVWMKNAFPHIYGRN